MTPELGCNHSAVRFTDEGQWLCDGCEAEVIWVPKAEVDRLRAQVAALIDAFTYERDGWRWTSFHADVDATPEIRAILAEDYAKEER